MGELINGKTPDEIKAAVINCDEHCSCIDCPEDERDYCDQSVVIKYARLLIERLEAEHDAALAKVPKWIPVRDQIPELDRLVVFGYSDKQFIYNGYLSSDDLKWMGYDDNRVMRPSHWMPLPQPPKEDE